MDQEDIKNEYLDFLRIFTKEEVDIIKIYAIQSTIGIYRPIFFFFSILLRLIFKLSQST